LNEKTMTIIREFPVNPQILIYHVRDRLTSAIIETYHPRSQAKPPDFVHKLLKINDIIEINIMPYRIWLRKTKSAGWQPLIPPIERILSTQFDVSEVGQPVLGDQTRSFHHSLPHLQQKQVYEAPAMVKSDPLAIELFAIDGVQAVTITPEEIQIKKAQLFSWSELIPQIESTLSGKAI